LRRRLDRGASIGTRKYDFTFLQAVCKIRYRSEWSDRRSLSTPTEPARSNDAIGKEFMMKQQLLKRTILAAALLSLTAAVPLAAGAAGAADNASSSTSAKSSTMTQAKNELSSSDKKFVENAAQGGVAEVEMGKLAAQKAQNAEVKQFGDRMVKDHSAANDKLMKLASDKGVAASTEMDASTKREYDKLSKLSGARFDQEYMKSMVSDHEKDVKEFQSEAKSAKDPDVKSFAENTLPTLEEHLKLAKSAEASAKREKAASK
jgi:putative membrane protein